MIQKLYLLYKIVIKIYLNGILFNNIISLTIKKQQYVQNRGVALRIIQKGK